MEELKKFLDGDKVKFNFNKNPIKMDLFLSFLKVEVKRSKDHLGSGNGWTLLENVNLGLKISGGMVEGVELLDTLQFGEKLSNQYNNYVNPFFLFEILNEAGQSFFVEYYKDDIVLLLEKRGKEIAQLHRKLYDASTHYDKLFLEANKLFQKTNINIPPSPIGE